MACRILLVEDNADDAALLRQALAEASFPFQLTHIPGGTRVVEQVEQAIRAEPKPHLLVLDYHLPACTGLELLAALQSGSPRALKGIEVVVLGGAMGAVAETAFRDLGVQHILEKPFSYDAYLDVGRQLREWCPA